MLKRDLVNAVSDQINGHLKKDVNQVVDIILDSISDALHDGRRVEIRGFGSLSVRERKSRTTKNPRTSEVMHISSRKSVHFTMSKSIKEPLVLVHNSTKKG
ncbi:MAG: integration host factor subunit beta [Desulfobulbaceae bacterium DB1]|nr:MAG: integration host factor subunit beta [Desulfobulbaceae bacterium DB1]